MNIDNYQISIVKIIQADWHNAFNYRNYNNYTQINTSSNDEYCIIYKPCKSCSNKYYIACKKPKPQKYVNNQLYIKYTFKEFTHYIKAFNNGTKAWMPFNNISTNTLLSVPKQYYVSSNMLADLQLGKEIGEVPVVYPDYSKVDVGEGITWPKKVFAPFVDTTAWPPYSLVDDLINYGVKYFNLGFIVSQNYTVCEPSWATYYLPNNAPINDQIKKIRNLGGDVCVSFGGAAGEPFHLLAPDVNTIFTQYKLFCDAYGLRRIDLDLEGNWISKTYAEGNKRNAEALKMLQDYYKQQGKDLQIWFTLPILPTGLTANGLIIVQQAFNAGVNIAGVNAMTMDYGSFALPNPTGNMGLAGIQAITSLKSQLKTIYGGTKTDSQLWEMIGTTPLIGVNDVPTEIFTQSDAKETLAFGETYNIGMISMWSANRDIEGNAKTGIPQAINEFTKIFNTYTSL